MLEALGEPLRFAMASPLLARVGLFAPSRTYIPLRSIYARGSATIPLAENEPYPRPFPFEKGKGEATFIY
jgi:hypothetical protein